jgi:hypothetical protein
MKNRFTRWGALAVLTLGLAVALPARAQNPTGEVTGAVTDADGAALPGVAVTATSPSLQGSRTAVTGQNGSYKLALLPPGAYTLTYELDAFGTVTREERVSAALTNRVDVELALAAVTEEILVTGEAGTISESVTGAASYTQAEIEMLPILRDLDSTVQLAPGVHATGPEDANGERPLSIAGGLTYENLWTLNGVVINENIRGSELPLFIEDAIQETTVQVSGVSAEYGRFAGGMINAITKSGGNDLSASLRVGVTNDDWVSQNELSPERVDDPNQVYEATLGGYLWKDHLWFFAAGRDVENTLTRSLPLTNLDVVQDNAQTRVEGKLTGTIADNHSLIASYLDIDQASTNTFFSGNIDDAGLTDREDPQSIGSLSYTGILTPSLFVEAQYSEREWVVSQGGGAKSRDLIDGTLMRTRQGAFRYHTPTFCGVCEDEERNNENVLGKVSTFLSTDTLGTHDLVFGVDQFSDQRFAINHQTGSDFTVWDSNFVIEGENIFPQFFPLGNDAGQPETWIGWFAVFNPDQAQTTDFKTNSLYVNDRWSLDERWSFNIGARYDENDGENSGGVTVADDAKISPRLGATFDVGGNGDLVLHASYGSYVAGLANSIGDSSSGGGAIGLFLSEYSGPTVNGTCGAGGPCLSTEEALALLFDWYLSNGGTTDIDGDLSGIPNLFSVSWPGLTAVVPDTLRSQATDEITVGATKRLGQRGLLRADVVYRDYDDFYANRTLPNQQVQVPFLGAQDLTEVGNFADDTLSREYLGLHLQGRYRVGDRLTFNANYTLSELEGNVEGENATSGPIAGFGGGPNTPGPAQYVEYFDTAWAYPEGYLDGDQRHKLQAWAIYDLLDTAHHDLSVSLLQSFFSGQAYSLVGAVDTRPFVTNPGYESPPTLVDYYFSERGEFNADDVTRSDLSLNYSFLWAAFGRDIEVYLQPEVINLFDEDGLEEFDTRIRTANQANLDGACPGSGQANGRCIAFDPFTETPVEGVHWAKRSTFGQPLEEDDFQTPRTYRFSVGFRF